MFGDDCVMLVVLLEFGVICCLIDGFDIDVLSGLVFGGCFVLYVCFVIFDIVLFVVVCVCCKVISGFLKF